MNRANVGHWNPAAGCIAWDNFLFQLRLQIAQGHSENHNTRPFTAEGAEHAEENHTFRGLSLRAPRPLR